MTNIGVFDSGLGGLAVLNKLSSSHKANYFYLGDNKRVPYGGRSKEEIIKFSIQIVKFLEQFDIDFYVVACNTMAVNSIKELEKTFDKKFISVTQMGIESLLEKKGDAYVLATEATVNSHVYKDEISKRSNKKVIEVKAPKLVDLIEEGLKDKKELNKYIDYYLKEANDKKIENIILGCTHYPIIEDDIRNRLKYDAEIIDPSIYLSKNLEFEENTKTKLNIFMTDVNPVTTEMTEIILNQKVNIRQVEL